MIIEELPPWPSEPELLTPLALGFLPALALDHIRYRDELIAALRARLACATQCLEYYQSKLFWGLGHDVRAYIEACKEPKL